MENIQEVAQVISSLSREKPQVLLELDSLTRKPENFQPPALPALFALLESGDEDVFDATLSVLERVESRLPAIPTEMLTKGLSSPSDRLAKLILAQIEKMDNIPADLQAGVLDLVPRTGLQHPLSSLVKKHPELVTSPNQDISNALHDPMMAMAFLEIIADANVGSDWIEPILVHLKPSDPLVYSALVETLCTIISNPNMLNVLHTKGVLTRLSHDLTQANRLNIVSLLHFFTKLAMVDSQLFEKVDAERHVLQTIQSRFPEAPENVLTTLCDLSSIDAKYVTPFLSDFWNGFETATGPIKTDYLQTLDAFLQNPEVAKQVAPRFQPEKILPGIYVPETKLVSLSVLNHATLTKELCDKMISQPGFIDAIVKRDEQDLEARKLRYNLVCNLLDRGQPAGHLGASLLKYRLDGVNPSEPSIMFAPS